MRTEVGTTYGEGRTEILLTCKYFRPLSTGLHYLQTNYVELKKTLKYEIIIIVESV